jgi:hypothetical protein
MAIRASGILEDQIVPLSLTSYKPLNQIKAREGGIEGKDDNIWLRRENIKGRLILR